MSRKKFDVSQSAVEFALVIPVLLLLIFGMLEMGHLIFVFASVLNASREAARYGAMTGIVNGNPQYQDCTRIAQAATGLRFLANFTESDVVIKYDQGPGPAPDFISPAPNAIGPCSTMTSNQWTSIGTGSRIVVTITEHYKLMLPLIPIPPFPMVSTSARTILGSISISGTVVAPPSMSIPPSIFSVNPNSGPTTGGTSVIISGLNLSGASITFASAYATCDLINANSTHITCTSPAHSAGGVSVSATTIGGTAILANAFTYVPPPTITSVSPTGGPVVGGTTVTITGTNLTNFWRVTFGGVSATGCSGTTTQITCYTPLHAAGLVDVAVATPGGPATKTGAFTFVEPPILDSISPVTGPAAGGTSVTLKGNFLTNATVKFGTTTATSCTVTVTQIICGAPAGSGTVDVSVTTLGGTATLTNAFTYTAIDSISPPAGKIAGGETVIISGTGFNGFTEVKIGGVSATDCSGTPTQITCTTPAHATAGLVAVAVTTPGGTTTKSNFFRYYDIPTITAVSPIGGPIAGGTIVTITGTNLTGLLNLTFGGAPTPFPCTINSITQITCTAPDYALVGPPNVPVDVVATTPGGSVTKSGGYTYYPMPTITSLVPSAGPLTSGYIVTINGTNLNNGTVTVTFAGTVTPSACTLTSATLITCPAPAHAAGPVDVILTNQGGSVPKTGAYTYYPAPTITTISPLYGPLSPLTTDVTITGTNMVTGLTQVTFGGVSATCTVILTTQVNCTAPAHATGVVDVVLTTPGGTATKTGGFSYTIMVITSVEPVSGKIAGGQTVIVYGDYLGYFTSVTFGGVPATSCQFATNKIMCTTPAHAAGFVDVSVISTDGTATIANAFKYVSIPTISGISPSGGPAGTPVTINGTNLSDVTLVDFGTVPTASACTVISSTQITCIAPAQAVGGLTVNITVTTPGGTVTSGNSSNDRFKYP